MRKKLAQLRVVCILFIALLYVWFPRKSRQNENFGIIQTAKLGDMVCTTPMFRAYKEKYPNGCLVVYGTKANQTLLQGNPYIDAYEVLTSSLSETVRQLKHHNLKAVCFTSPSLEITSACIFARIPLIIGPRIQNGWSPYETWSYKILSRFITIRPHHMGTYAPREYLRLLEPIGINTSDTKKHLYYTKNDADTVMGLLATHAEPNNMLIGILLGAGNDIKSWAPEKFAELMNMITEMDSGTRFVLIGTEKDHMRSDIVVRQISAKVQVIDLVNKLSLAELKACISKLSMVIGADTGPQYVAEALNVPTIDIVGPVDEREQPPSGSLHRIVKPDRIKPQLQVMNARVYDKEELDRQVNFTTVEMVYDEYLKLARVIKNKSNIQHVEKIS